MTLRLFDHFELELNPIKLSHTFVLGGLMVVCFINELIEPKHSTEFDYAQLSLIAKELDY